jgi:hypothetical protein
MAPTFCRNQEDISQGCRDFQPPRPPPRFWTAVYSQGEIFWEEVFSPQILVPTYNVFVRLEMTKGDYLIAKADAVKNLRDRFKREGNTRAKEKAEKLLEDLKQDFYGHQLKQDRGSEIEEYALN